MFDLSFDWNAQTIMFFVFAACIISGAVLMVHFSKVVHMVVSLAFTFIGLAGVYIMLEAEFIAFVQVLVYAGAISILMIFGIMMTQHDKQDAASVKPMKEVLAGVGCIALFGVLFFAIRGTAFPTPADKSLAVDNTMELGKKLFTEHVIPFELLSVLLTVAFIGAIVLAKQEDPDEAKLKVEPTTNNEAIKELLRQSVPADSESHKSQATEEGESK
ncbi:NADH-quinone oxidoreductase subunit J [Paenibacillus marinisediminis]